MMLTLYFALVLFQPQEKIAFPTCDDPTFMRRVWLDLAGTLPPRDVFERQQQTATPWDRAALVDEVLQSADFTDRWTYFLEELTASSVRLDPFIRNAYHGTLREGVSKNVPMDELVYDLLRYRGYLQGTGSSYNLFKEASVNPLNRQDTLDDQVAFITERFLGIQTQCISCHDGANHLEEQNLFLAHQKRAAFWGMAAMLAKTGLDCPKCYELDKLVGAGYLVDTDHPDFDSASAMIYTLSGDDFHNGEYVADTQVGDGMRSPRSGGVIEPAYLFTGETPRADETRRQALARMITEDRQFARNLVNRIWKHLFGRGFVEPLDGFDLYRLNGELAARYGVTVQPQDPELMEYMTDQFIELDYDLRAFLAMITSGPLYQLDYRDLPDTPGQGPYWGGSARLRRLSAEGLASAVYRVAQVEPRYMVQKNRRLITSIWQLPGSDEPLADPDQVTVEHLEEMGQADLAGMIAYQENLRALLDALGRGDRAARAYQAEDLAQEGVLALLNGTWLEDVLQRSPYVLQQAERVENGEGAAVTNHLYQRTLGRIPQAEEETQAMTHLSAHDPETAVRDLLWSLCNHPEFLFR